MAEVLRVTPKGETSVEHHSHGRDDARVDSWLRTIALRGETPAWQT
jgi:hypothetical protein